jgi:hypothetical protein
VTRRGGTISAYVNQWTKRGRAIDLAGANNEVGAAAATVAEAKALAVAEDAEEDDERGEDAVQLWLAALAAAEHASEPVVRTVEQSD